MTDKPLFVTKLIFYALVGIFIVLASYIIFPLSISIKRAVFPLIAILAILFSLLGVALIYVTLKFNIKGKLKKYLILSGASAIGIPISAILHNLIYGLFIYCFGNNFWDRIGLKDEPVFFLLAIIVFPILFLFGLTGSVLMFIKNRKKSFN
jgi:hypothetical protein